MNVYVPENISVLLVEFAVESNASPPRDPNDDDDADEDDDEDEGEDYEADPAVIREPDEWLRRRRRRTGSNPVRRGRIGLRARKSPPTPPVQPDRSDR
jgi:hypothetical protein